MPYAMKRSDIPSGSLETELVSCIREAARALLEQRDGAAELEIDARTRLYGSSGLFDSLDLVHLVVALEEEIEDRYGKQITIANERALSRYHSPFVSVGALAAYLEELLREEGQHA